MLLIVLKESEVSDQCWTVSTIPKSAVTANVLSKYSFKTGKEVATIFDVETARDCTIKHFDDYIMSPNESLILIQTDTKPIYRHSFTANYYIFNVKNNKMEPLSTGGPQQVPLFSPDGNQIAFVRNNNIYLVQTPVQQQRITDYHRRKIQ